ncbi:hypothetical protein [Lacticaseibacillus daqingensis]|uniref:hypothetical protein n=1 Tax=Lacticaseibacillus daqingensis TaxID=2486014 RepID=UPI000F7AFC4F|nr:hypothetical protein [Lacticaseibacillus daqingensis]
MSTVNLIVRVYTDLDHRQVVEVIYASADHAKALTRLNQLRHEATAAIHLLLYTVPLDTDLPQLATYPVIETSPHNLKGHPQE